MSRAVANGSSNDIGGKALWLDVRPNDKRGGLKCERMKAKARDLISFDGILE